VGKTRTDNRLVSDIDAQQNEKIESLQRRETILFILAILGFVVAAGSVAVSLLQWQSMQQQLLAMREQLADARAQTHLEYRPWVLAQRAELVAPLTAGQSALLGISIVNGGRTPATNVRVHTTITFHEYTWPAEGRVADRVEPSAVLIGGEASKIHLVHFEPLSSARLASVMDNTSPLRWQGELTYQDIFNDEHKTEFCYHTQAGRNKNVSVVPCENNNRTK